MANEFIIRKGFKSKEDSQITGSISLSGSFKDQESSSGTAGQVLSSTVSGSQWVDAADSGAITGTGTTGTLTKWTTGGEVIGNSIITEGSSKINISGNVDIIKTTSDVAGELRIGGTLASDNLPFGKINFANTNAANSQVNDILAYIAGEKIISSNTAHLTFATSNNSAPVERMRITSGGNVGIGVTPSAWRDSSAVNSVVQGADNYAIFNRNDSGTKTNFFAQNFYYNTSDVGARIDASKWSLFYTQNQEDGSHGFYTSSNNSSTTPSMQSKLTISSGGAATFSGKITADAGIDIDNFNIDGTTISLSSGNMIIGTANAASALTISDYGLLTMTVGSSSNPRLTFAGADVSGTHFIQLNRGTSAMEFYVNGATRATIASGGDATFAKSIKFADGAAFAGAASIRRQSNALILTGGSSGFYFNDDTNAVSNLVIASTGQTTITCTSSQPTLTINGTDSYSWLQTQVSGVNKWAIGNVTVANGTDLELYSYTGGNGTRLTVGSGGHIIQDTTSATSTYFQVRSLGTTRGYFGVADALLNAPTTNSQFCIRSEVDFAIATGGGTRRLSISSGGDVGIGHTGYNGYRLMTRGVDSTSSNFAFFAENSGTYGLLSVRNDGYITFNNIGSTSPYQYAVSGRDAILNSSGEIGTSASIRKAKINIENETDVSWLYDLNPVKFNYRKKDEKLNYLNEAEEEQRHGLIAEEVEEVNTDFCWYNVNEEGDKDLAGVDYKMLITPMLKAIQEQQTIIQDLKSRIETLEG